MKTVLHFLIRRGLIETRSYLVVSLRVEHQLDVQIFTRWQITQAVAPLAFARWYSTFYCTPLYWGGRLLLRRCFLF